MNTVISTLPRTAAAILLAFVLAGTALAIERPAGTARAATSLAGKSPRGGHAGHGRVFRRRDCRDHEPRQLLTDEQVALVVRLYCLMRQMAEQDAWLLVVESSETLIRLRGRSGGRTGTGRYQPRLPALCRDRLRLHPRLVRPLPLHRSLPVLSGRVLCRAHSVGTLRWCLFGSGLRGVP